jgi:LmbE family N-acetylglucosaminyl deacetylase
MSAAGSRWAVLAIAAHPDDIEFMMSGTLLRLGAAGAELHMWNLCSGNCGTESLSADEIRRQRAGEALASAQVAGATLYPPLADDLELLYEVRHLRRIAAVIRQVQPTIILTQSPADYMEDHQNTTRLVVTAAFAKGMMNFVTEPPTAPWNQPAVVYHALPHGLHDGLRHRVRPELFVDIEPVLETKRRMLACHVSQKAWLDATQGMGSYVHEMERLCRLMGTMSGRFALAEAWRRHLHLGFAPEGYDPLAERLGLGCWVDPTYTAHES